MSPVRVAAYPRLAGFLLACALGWVVAQGSLLVISKGLLASYDFPGHLHMSVVQVRSPTALWDDSWYAGYPTYAYPPLAHRLAGEFMEHLGVEYGFKAAVVLAYIAAVPGLYALARVAAGLPPVPAAASALVISVSPSLFRAFLFGQYPALVAYTFFLGVLAAVFACLQSPRRNPLLILLTSFLVAALGSTHLYALVLLVLLLIPLGIIVNFRFLLSRVALPLIGGILLGALPSALLLTDFRLLSKTPIPHVTRSVAMIEPAGMLDWVLYPAGLPVVLGCLVLGPVLIGGRRWVWMGSGLAVGLVLYLRGELGLAWGAAAVLCALMLGMTIRRYGVDIDWQTRYFAWAGLISLWLALGPAGGLARLLPFSAVLVYDRPLLYGVPLAWLALARVLWRCALPFPWRRIVPAVLLLTAGPLMVLSIVHVLRTYAALVPGAEGAIPRGTPLRATYTDYLKQQDSTGRLLPLGFPPIVYTLPDVVGTPLIDGAYNDARVLAPLRASGVEAIGSEKFANRDLRVTRFFLTNADRYGIEWVMTADRYYDQAIPLDRFLLVYESQADPNHAVRLYRSVFPPHYAWIGAPQYRVFEMARVSLQGGPWGTGGSASGLAVAGEGAATALTFRGTSEIGWAFTEHGLPSGGRRCNRLVFDAWSPTGAALTVRVLQEGRFRIVRPEAPLAPARSSVRLALDCGRIQRVHIAISGVGEQRAILTPVRYERVEDATTWVPFERVTAECVRASIPQAETAVTLSVPYFPRWRVESGQDVVTGSDSRGLLTLTGPPGRHTVCLSFPAVFRAARTYLPVIYLGLVIVFGVLVWATRLAVRPSLAPLVVLLLGLFTALREVVLRHRLQPENAWDHRARTAPDWYATFTNTRQQSHESAYADLTEVLRGVDRAWLHHAVVLDVGCGPGRLLGHMAPLAAAVYGVDISGEMVTLARERLRGLTNVTVMKNDGRTFSMFPDEMFDFVYSVNVFQHIPYRPWIESYMGEIHRVLRVGGEARIQVDGRGESLVWRLAKTIVGYDSWAGVLFTRQELSDIALRHGFVVVHCGYSHQDGIRWKRQGLWLRVRRD